MTAQHETSKVWYKEPWPWILMVGPGIVVVAAIATFFIAKNSNSDLVTDDYYKEGKYISVQLERDEEAFKRKIKAEVLVNPDNDAAKVFVSGNFDRSKPLYLLFLHPAKQSFDQRVKLQQVSSGDKSEYMAVFKPLPQAQHWYVRVEDGDDVWRVEDRWLVNQGNAMALESKDKLLGPQTSATR